MLANETLKIIIAVICIGFLAYFLSMLYVSKVGEQKKVDAQMSLERVEEIVTSLNVGASERQGIGNPKGWHLYSFVSGTKPNSCAGESCLCICGSAFDLGGTFDRQIQKCDADGTCLSVRALRTSDLDIKIMGENSLVIVEVRKTEQGIFISQVR